MLGRDLVGQLPDIGDVQAAAARIGSHVHRTPVLTSASIDALAGARLHFKCEHLQRAGAFKYRGATNAVLSLDDATAARGVAAHSSGNHAAALALAAATRGIPCQVVMPANAPAAKLEATRAYGASVVLCERTLSILLAHRVEVVTVTEEEIVGAMALIFERLKQVVEPSAAVALAGALVLARRGALDGGDVGVILSGGNVDLAALPFVARDRARPVEVPKR
ncbi:MAG: pyridoxal-phosphate dependent enzyme [Acidimicrobiales bacterium]